MGLNGMRRVEIGWDGTTWDGIGWDRVCDWIDRKRRIWIDTEVEASRSRASFNNCQIDMMALTG